MRLVTGDSLILSKALPSVSLIKGLASEEDRLLVVSDLISVHSIVEADTLTLDSLTSETSGSIHKFCTTAPFGKLKLTSLNLEGSSGRMQNTLLKLLETPYPSLKFVLFSNSAVLNTIESRSQVFWADFDYSTKKDSKSRVLEALKACISRDRLLLEKSMKYWDTDCHSSLLSWVIEARSGHSQLFDRSTLRGFYPILPYLENLLYALLNVDEARPRISDHAIILSLLEDLRG